ncbi:MAG: dihydrodipicolinate synthase family protein [Bryobacterales bacterium]|nr:dihydrodipicolinate synthase family protein [Bryobacterales bacterium]
MPQFDGVLAAAVTPSRTDAYQMDLGAALEVIDFLNAQGVRGIALFGATGEFPHFPTEERIRFTHMAIKRSRVPLIVNATHSCFEEAEKIAEDAIANGAAGLLLMPPYFFRYSAEEIREFMLRMKDEIGKQVPLLLYNLPAFNNAIPIEVALELIEQDVVAGIKDSSGDWTYLLKLIEARRSKEFVLMVGNDNLLTRGRTAGADGVISGCACAVPELVIGLNRAIERSSDATIVMLTARLAEFIRWIETFPGPSGVREAVGVRGIKVGLRSIPFAQSTEKRMEEFRNWFREWLPVVVKEAQQA